MDKPKQSSVKSSTSSDYKDSDLPPLPPPSNKNGSPQPPIPVDNKRPSLTKAPDIPPGNKRPSLSSIEQPTHVSQGNLVPQTSKQKINPSRKFSAPGPKPTKSAKPELRKQSLPAISQPIRQPSFQDYKNNIVPIPEPPTEETHGIYLDEADLRGLATSNNVSMKNKDKEDNEDTTEHKDDENKPKNYEILNRDLDFNSSQDIYMDLNETQ